MSSPMLTSDEHNQFCSCKVCWDTRIVTMPITPVVQTSKDVALRLRELADELPTKPVHLGLLQQALRGGAADIEQLRAALERSQHQITLLIGRARGNETCEQPPMPFEDWAADIRTVSMQQTIHAYKDKIRKLEYQLACRPSEKAATDETLTVTSDTKAPGLGRCAKRSNRVQRDYIVQCITKDGRATTSVALRRSIDAR